VAEEHRIDVRARQEPLRARYREDPREAGITDGARTVGGAHLDPVHGRVRPGSVDHGIDWDFGIHRAVGGDHDLPNPGDILPVGFQKMRCNVDIAATDGTDPKTVEKLVRAAEHSRVCLQTIRSGVPVETVVTGA
jgi:hypothetical protein